MLPVNQAQPTNTGQKGGLSTLPPSNMEPEVRGPSLDHVPFKVGPEKGGGKGGTLVPIGVLLGEIDGFHW